MNKKQLIVTWGILVLVGFIFFSCIGGIRTAYTEESKYSSSDIDSFLFAMFYNNKDKLRRWDNETVGIRVYGATEDEERMMNEICKLLTTITGKSFKRYYSEDIIVEFDNYFNKQMYGDRTIGISHDYDGKILNINRVKIDHQHPLQYKIALHELLHAIGYKRHSLNPYSIMYPSIAPNQELTVEDIQIIKMLYDPYLNLKNGMTYDEVNKVLHGWQPVREEKDLEDKKEKTISYGVHDECKIEGIFYNNGKYGALIGESTYHLNDFVCGGKIIKFYRPEELKIGHVTDYDYRIVIKFADKEKIYGIGDMIESSKDKSSDKSLPHEELSIEVRKKIFYEACEAENKAIRETKAKYPFSGTLNREESGNRSEMTMNLMRKYRKEVWDKYNISEDQGVEIGGEGIEKHWPQPPWESPW